MRDEESRGGHRRRSGRGAKRGGARLAAALALAAGAVGCLQLGFPRVHVAVASPAGDVTAEVRNAPSIDPPQQSLWLRYAGGRSVELRRLAGDQDWCHTVVWSADGERVAFLIQDVEAAVYEASSGREIAALELAPRDAYPPTERIAQLEFAEAGDALVFRRCERAGESCGEVERSGLPTAGT